MSVHEALSDLEEMIARRVDDVAAFRATVAALSGGMVQIVRQNAATADLRFYARAAGFALTVGDEVLCENLNGQPVVVARLQRGSAAAYQIGDAAADELTLWGHLTNKGGTPTYTAGAGAGTSPTLAAIGNDTSGRFNITAGTTPAAGILGRVAFAAARVDGNFQVSVTAENVSAGAIQLYQSGRTPAYFEISVAGTPVAGTLYAFGYFVIGH